MASAVAIIVVFGLILCVAVILLPQASGLTHLERKRKEKVSKPINNHYTEYTPPDALRSGNDQGMRAKVSAISEKFAVTSEDMPVKIRLNEQAVLKRRTERGVKVRNPNDYDYDLDELIREESENAHKEVVREFYANEKIGGDKEEMV